jgi:hypothetical protein
MTILKAVLIILVLALPLSAQSKGYTIIPSDKSATCAATVQALDEALQVVSFPDGQKFLVACDEAAWANVRKMVPTLNDTHHAGTIFDAHTTIIRGAMMGQNIDKFHNLHVLRHEAWHQRLMTADEDLVIRATSKEENGQRVEAVFAKLEKEVR